MSKQETPPPSTPPLSLPVKSRPRTENRLGLSEDRGVTTSQQRFEEDPTTASSSIPTPAPALAKRRHALLELLTSERAYASDLALLRDVYMRLASGYPPSFGPSRTKRPVSCSEISNPGSNASSSSSESTKSSSGTCSSLSSCTVSTVSHCALSRKRG
ncbi:hypothetical protein BDR05DRAFT_1063387 [Suillus weaverae]|nr:hypothetical protein BDR05DRAFT_1063387 [Suillus weaverae]